MSKKYFNAEIMTYMLKTSRTFVTNDLKNNYEKLLNEYNEQIDDIEDNITTQMYGYLKEISNQFNENELFQINKTIDLKNKKLYDNLLKTMKTELIEIEDSMLEKIGEKEQDLIILAMEDILSSKEFDHELIISLIQSNKSYKRVVNKYVNDLYKLFLKENKKHIDEVKNEIIQNYNKSYKETMKLIGHMNKVLFFNHNKELRTINDRINESKKLLENKGNRGFINNKLNQLNLNKLYLNIPYNNTKILDVVLNLFNFVLFVNDTGCQNKIKGDKQIMDISKISCTDNKINSYFENIQSIGVKSANGIIFKLNIEELGEESTFVIKTNVSDYADPLEYEYDIQSSLNELRKNIPNFSLAFGIFKCEPVKEVLQIRSLKSRIDRVNRDAKINIENQLKRNFSSINSVCKVNENKRNNFIFTVTEFVENPLTLSEFALENATNADDIIDILIQTTCALQIAQEEKHFTHYDLHSGNVLIKKVQDIDSNLKNNMVPVFGYKFNDLELGDNIPYFFVKAKYLAIIIDFGRSYIKDKTLFYNPMKTKPNDSGWTKKYGITPNKFSRYWDIARLWSVTLADGLDNPKIKNKDKLNVLFDIMNNFFDCGDSLYLGDLSKANDTPSTLLNFLITISMIKYRDNDDRIHSLINNPINKKMDNKNQPIYLFNDKKQGKYNGINNSISSYMKNIDKYAETFNDLKFNMFVKNKLQVGGKTSEIIKINKQMINKNNKMINKNKGNKGKIEIKKL